MTDLNDTERRIVKMLEEQQAAINTAIAFSATNKRAGNWQCAGIEIQQALTAIRNGEHMRPEYD